MKGSVTIAWQVLIASGLTEALDSIEAMIQEMGEASSFGKEGQETTAQRARQWFVGEMSKLIAKHFDNDELADILEFLQSKVGKKFVQFQLGTESEGLLQKLVERIAEGDSELWKE
jgi:hypothetical protein